MAVENSQNVRCGVDGMIAPTMPTMPSVFDEVMMADELARDEGIRLVVYDDATGLAIKPGTLVIGHPTIGIGRALDVNGISATEALGMCEVDIADYLRELRRLSWFNAMDGVRQRAIVNMRHQLGLSGLLAFHDMISAIAARAWTDAVAAGRASKWYRDTPVRGARVMSLLQNGSDTHAAPGTGRTV
jgi:lysozyme